MNELQTNNKNVVVLGASHKPHRTSYQAIEMLIEKGYQVFPVHPVIEEVLGLKVFHSLNDISEKIDTITVYISEAQSAKIENEILQVNPRRIIFNPGAENDTLFQKAKEKGIEVEAACSLILMGTGQF